MPDRAYLDHNATSPLRIEARLATESAFGLGNPSSVHEEGRLARETLEEARARVASALGDRSATVIFTSGATEAAFTALVPNWQDGRAIRSHSRLLVGATEHSCVLNGGRFPTDRVGAVPVDRQGRIDLSALSRALELEEHPLVAVALANGETGVLQDIPDVAGLVHDAGGTLVCDLAQAVGRVPVELNALGADAVLISSHKLGGPAGAGAVVVPAGRPVPTPLIGGVQESGFRGGTENVPAIFGFAAALELAVRECDASAQRLRRLRVHLEDGIGRTAPTATIHGSDAPRLPNTTLFSFGAVPAETAHIAFDLDGVAVSTGSACSSGKVGTSHVLEAMGVDAPGAIRLSFGHGTDLEHIDRALRTIARLGARDAEKAGTALRSAA